MRSRSCEISLFIFAMVVAVKMKHIGRNARKLISHADSCGYITSMHIETIERKAQKAKGIQISNFLMEVFAVILNFN